MIHFSKSINIMQDVFRTYLGVDKWWNLEFFLRCGVKSSTKKCLNKYLGHTKSSEPYFLVSFLLLEKIFFSYKQIERLLLYLSMLFDKYSIDIMIMKSSWKLFSCNSIWYQECVLSSIRIFFVFSLFFSSSLSKTRALYMGMISLAGYPSQFFSI